MPGEGFSSGQYQPRWDRIAFPFSLAIKIFAFFLRASIKGRTNHDKPCAYNFIGRSNPLKMLMQAWEGM
jgi:hypothetical protein